MKKYVGKKFLTKDGRFGKVEKKTKKNYHVRTVGKNELRNIYSYPVKPSYFKRVIAWFDDEEIKFMYKKIVHYKNGREVRTATEGDEHKREKRYL